MHYYHSVIHSQCEYRNLMFWQINDNTLRVLWLITVDITLCQKLKKSTIFTKTFTNFKYMYIYIFIKRIGKLHMSNG